MLSGFDERGQAIQIGAVLIFGILIIAFSSYQAFVVPDQNEQVEFQHNQNVRGQMVEVRSDILNAGTSDSPVSSSVTLGTTLPARAVAVNPSAPSGSLRTAEFDGGSSIAITDAVAINDEVDDFWSGTTRRFSTSKFVYEPNYAEYQNAPTTTYENTVVFNEFRTRTVLSTGQALVDGREIDLTALQGSYETTQSGSVSISFTAPAGKTDTISVQRASAGNPVTLRVPTSAPIKKWESLLESQRKVNGGYITDLSKSSGVLKVELAETDGSGNPVLYELHVSAVGVGTEIPEPEPAYLTTVTKDRIELEAGETRTLIAAVNNKFNGPESGVLLSADASPGTATVTGPSNDKGRAIVEYTAPPSSGTYTVTLKKDFDGSDSFEADEQVQYTISVAGSTSGADSTAPEFSSGPTVDPSTVGQGERFDLTATLSDIGNGGTDILSASWSDDKGNGGTLAADDGEFDQAEEAVSTNVDTDGWSKEDHTLTVIGSDANGNSASGTVTVTVDGSSPGGQALQFVSFTDNEDGVVYFNVDNTGDTDLTVDEFSIDATDLNSGAKLQDGGNELEIRGSSTEGGASKGGNGKYDADGTIYDLETNAIINSQDTDVAIDIRTVGSGGGDNPPLNFELQTVDNRADADVVVTLRLVNNPDQVFYFKDIS